MIHFTQEREIKFYWNKEIIYLTNICYINYLIIFLLIFFFEEFFLLILFTFLEVI